MLTVFEGISRTVDPIGDVICLWKGINMAEFLWNVSTQELEGRAFGSKHSLLTLPEID